MKHIKLFEEFINESGFKSSDINKTVAYIKSEVGTNPGYVFFGDDDDIEEFDNMWNNETYKDALNLLASLDDVDLTNFKDVKDFIKNN